MKVAIILLFSQIIVDFDGTLAGSNERRNHSSCEVTATPERNDYAHKLHLEGNGINSPAPLNEHGYLFLEPVSDDCPGEVLLVVN